MYVLHTLLSSFNIMYTIVVVVALYYTVRYEIRITEAPVQSGCNRCVDVVLYTDACACA